MFLANLAWGELSLKRDVSKSKVYSPKKILIIKVVAASWRHTGIFPLDQMVIESGLNHRFASTESIVKEFEEIKHLVLTSPPGQEGDIVNQIFAIACRVAPVYKILLDDSQKEDEGRCSLCKRKNKRTKLKLLNLHDGCCLTSVEVVQQVEAVANEREQARKEKLLKQETKMSKVQSRQLAEAEPFCTDWIPDYLTKKQLVKALNARGINQLKDTDPKSHLIKLVEDGNRIILQSLHVEITEAGLQDEEGQEMDL